MALARALAFDPEILFFDEPLSALDYRLRKTLEKELKDLHARTGKTFVYITHSLEEAMVMSDRIAIMRAGRFEQIGAPEEIYARPASRFVAEFMGEVNLFPAAGGRFAHVAVDPAALDRSGLAGRGGWLMVRPEGLDFLGPGETAELSAGGILTARYVLGSRIQYQVTLADGHQVTVESLRENAFAGGEGDAVTVGCALSRCHLVPAD